MNKLIDNLNNIQKNSQRFTYDEFCTILSHLIPQVPIIPIISECIPRIDKGFYRDPSIIYRARPNEISNTSPSLSIPWSNILDISIVPEKDEEKIEFGRANKEKQPMFYASNDCHISCYETIWHKFPLQTIEKEKNLTVGVWEINQPLNLAFIPFSKSYVNRIKKPGQKIYDDINDLTIKFDNEIDTMLKTQSRNVTLDKFLLNFFSYQFAKLEINDKSDYYFSNFYCDQVFDRCPNDKGINDIDGIIFPSVCFSYQYYNLALHPRCLSKINFVSAMYVWVTYSTDTQDMSYIPLEQNIHADTSGQLNWILFKKKQ
jgi:hypothetical protein